MLPLLLGRSSTASGSSLPAAVAAAAAAAGAAMRQQAAVLISAVPPPPSPLQHQQQPDRSQHLQQLPSQQHYQQQLRGFSTSGVCRDLRDFFDSVDPQNAANGRAWSASELRNKSWDDLHKLWYVCLKERNMLLTQISWERAHQGKAQQLSPVLPSYTRRITHVKKTMNRIKQVLSERAHNEADAVKAANMKRVIHYL